MAIRLGLLHYFPTARAVTTVDMLECRLACLVHEAGRGRAAPKDTQTT